MYGITWSQMLPNLDGIPFIAATSITSLLISAAFSFKLAFTAADAPELVVGFAKTLNDTLEGQSLLWRARVVFIVIGLLSTFAIVRGVSGGRHARSASKTMCAAMYFPTDVSSTRVARTPHSSRHDAVPRRQCAHLSPRAHHILCH